MGTRTTGTKVHFERSQANASAAGIGEQALRAELELARKDAELARKDAEYHASGTQLSLEDKVRGTTMVGDDNIQDVINRALCGNLKLSLDPFQNISSSFNPVENLVVPKKPTVDAPYLLFDGLDTCTKHIDGAVQISGQNEFSRALRDMWSQWEGGYPKHLRVSLPQVLHVFRGRKLCTRVR